MFPDIQFWRILGNVANACCQNGIQLRVTTGHNCMSSPLRQTSISQALGTCKGVQSCMASALQHCSHVLIYMAGGEGAGACGCNCMPTTQTSSLTTTSSCLWMDMMLYSLATPAASLMAFTGQHKAGTLPCLQQRPRCGLIGPWRLSTRLLPHATNTCELPSGKACSCGELVFVPGTSCELLSLIGNGTGNRVATWGSPTNLTCAIFVLDLNKHGGWSHTHSRTTLCKPLKVEQSPLLGIKQQLYALPVCFKIVVPFVLSQECWDLDGHCSCCALCHVSHQRDF